MEAAGVDVTLFTGPALKLNNELGYPHFGLPQYADYAVDISEFASFLDSWLETASFDERRTLYAGKTLTTGDLELLGESLAAYANLLRRERTRFRSKIASPGFYRNANEPTVYKLNSDGTYCTVQNESQMEALGGPGGVLITDVRSATFLQGYKATPAGACSWPEGFYRKNGATEVFEVTADLVRRVRGKRAVTERATSVSADSDLLIGKELSDEEGA